MSDEPSVRGWLPPRAPGGQPPPRFEPAPPEPAPEPPAPEPPGWQPPVAQRAEWRAEPAAATTTVVRPAQPRASGLAITGMVLGIIGIGLLVLSVGTSFLLSLPCSGAGWACGVRARQSADADPASSSRSSAQAAVVIGMVGVGLGVLSAVVWIILLSAGVSIEDLRDWLQRQVQEERR